MGRTVAAFGRRIADGSKLVARLGRAELERRA